MCVTAQCLCSYGAGPDVCKGTAGIYLAFVYWLLPFNCLLLLSHFRVNSNFFIYAKDRVHLLGAFCLVFFI